MSELQHLVDQTTAAIAQVGVPDEAGWRFARAWIHVTRFGRNGRDTADLSAALADFDALPDDFPGRGKLASVLVTAMLQDVRLKTPEGLTRGVRLTAVADRDPRPLPAWPATAAAVRSLELLNASLTGAPGFNLRTAVRELDQLAETAAGHHPQADMVEMARSGLRAARDTNEGTPPAPTSIPGVPGDPVAPLRAEVMSAVFELNSLVVRGDVAAVRPVVQRMMAAADRLPPGDPVRERTAEMLTAVRPLLGLLDDGAGTPTDGVPGPDGTELAALVARAAQPGLSDAERALLLFNLGTVELARGFDSDSMLDSAVEHLRAAVATAPDHDHRLVQYLSVLGAALLRRAETRARRDDLTESIRLLERAREIAGSETHSQWTMLSNPLAHAYRMAGQRRRGRAVALAGLRGHAWNVLLQANAAEVHTAARDAAGDAVDVAGWCIEDNEPGDAAQALDAGRALILYSATETRDLGHRLTDEGRPDLADRWRRAVGEHGGAEHVPPDLRREVIGAIARIPLDAAGVMQAPPDAGSARLLSPPDLDEVRAALTTLGADVLVYLVPGDGRSGTAVVVPAAEPPSWVLLPRLDQRWGADFDTFLTATSRSTRTAGRPQGWDGAAPTARRILADLCERAWTDVVGPVLDRVPPRPDGEPPRVVLIPMGRLVRVPWHAARRPGAGRPRYALEDAVFSYAPSARLLCDVAWRGAVPATGDCLIVADPDTGGAAADLRAARTEAWAVREAFYPAARFVGRAPDGSTAPDGPGSRADVTDWLAGGEAGGEAGALLHLACHGVVEPGTATGDSSYLLLSGGERLSAEGLVSAAADVGRPIALAILGACSSGVCGRGDDEAFSLSTTLLANNVATVVGTQWSVPDRATSVLMFMFHHFLRTANLAPAEALRRAQLWMIAEGSPPETMPASVRAILDRTDPADPIAWAALVHFGR